MTNFEALGLLYQLRDELKERAQRTEARLKEDKSKPEDPHAEYVRRELKKEKDYIAAIEKAGTNLVRR